MDVIGITQEWYWNNTIMVAGHNESNIFFSYKVGVRLSEIALDILCEKAKSDYAEN